VTSATARPAGTLIGSLLIDVSLGSVPGGQGCDHLEQVGGARRSALDRADLNLDLALLDVVDRLIELDESAVKAPANDGPAFHLATLAVRRLGGQHRDEFPRHSGPGIRGDSAIVEHPEHVQEPAAKLPSKLGPYATRRGYPQGSRQGSSSGFPLVDTSTGRVRSVGPFLSRGTVPDRHAMRAVLREVNRHGTLAAVGVERKMQMLVRSVGSLCIGIPEQPEVPPPKMLASALDDPLRVGCLRKGIAHGLADFCSLERVEEVVRHVWRVGERHALVATPAAAR
jgi:hypothetical protein